MTPPITAEKFLRESLDRADALASSLARHIETLEREQTRLLRRIRELHAEIDAFREADEKRQQEWREAHQELTQ